MFAAGEGSGTALISAVRSCGFLTGSGGDVAGCGMLGIICVPGMDGPVLEGAPCSGLGFKSASMFDTTLLTASGDTESPMPAPTDGGAGDDAELRGAFEGAGFDAEFAGFGGGP